MFSGIDAASVAWRQLGWRAAAFCENEPFPSAVLAHHYPDVPNLGDVTKANFDAIGPVDLAVFGSPCQSFSIAGKRLGLDDPRGNLALLGGTVVYRKRPRWFVFENVPGLLSSDSGWDFGTLLAAFAGYPPGSVFEPPEGGWRNSGTVREAAPDAYGLAWRVLDAQYIRVDGFARAVPQRRRRVFVVGCLGSWRRAAAVLFERESLSGNPAPRRQAGQTTPPTLSARTRGGGGLGTDFDCDGGLIPAIASTGDVSHCLNAGGMGRIDYETETMGAHALRADGFDASEDGTGRGTPIIPIQEPTKRTGVSSTSLKVGDGIGEVGDPMFTLQAGAQHGVAIAFDETQITSAENRCNPQPGDPSHPLASGARPPTIAFNARQDPDVFHGHTGPLDTDGSTQAVLSSWRVRRLTPLECERLQGFPEVKKTVTVSVWPSIDQAENAARVGTLNPKSQRSASNAEGNGSARSASAAGGRSSICHQSPEQRVAVTVRIDYGRQQVAILKTGRLIWSASIAGKPSASPLLMPAADFVQLVANMLIRLDPITHAGGVGSRANINASSDHLNGRASVHLSGGEIAANAGDAEKFTTGIAACMKFTTSGAGRNFPISEPIWQTWCSCVTRAIGSCIPDEIRAASSFDVSIELTHGYTDIPYRGKRAADGPRYKALGNSMACNVMRWVGRRIQAVEAMSGDQP